MIGIYDIKESSAALLGVERAGNGQWRKKSELIFDFY